VHQILIAFITSVEWLFSAWTRVFKYLRKPKANTNFLNIFAILRQGRLVYILKDFLSVRKQPQAQLTYFTI